MSAEATRRAARAKRSLGQDWSIMRRFWFDVPGSDRPYHVDSKQAGDLFIGVVSIAEERGARPGMWSQAYCGPDLSKCRRLTDEKLALMKMQSEKFEFVAIPGGTHVVRARLSEPLKLYDVVIEHNTWECESWAHGVQVSQDTTAMMRELQFMYDRLKVTTDKFVHSAANIGRAKCEFTFRFGVPDYAGDLMGVHVRSEDSWSYRGREEVYRGGSYMARWNERDADWLRGAFDMCAAHGALATVYKGVASKATEISCASRRA